MIHRGLTLNADKRQQIAKTIISICLLNSFWYRCLKKNYEMCSDWRWRDFVLNFAVCSADFHSRKRIHDLVSITRIAFKD